MGKRFQLAWLPFALVLTGCASTFVVKSEPLQADVYLQDPASGEKKALGKTPIEMPSKALREAAGEGVASGEFFTVVVEKQGYVSEKFLVPASRFGTLVTSLDVKLKQGATPKEERSARGALDHLFLAQKLALAKQYERAQIELDKVLTEFPDFPRALAMRGSIYYVQKNFAESLKWYEEALKADPQMETALQMVTRIRNRTSGTRTPAGAGGK